MVYSRSLRRALSQRNTRVRSSIFNFIRTLLGAWESDISIISIEKQHLALEKRQILWYNKTKEGGSPKMKTTKIKASIRTMDKNETHWYYGYVLANGSNQIVRKIIYNAYWSQIEEAWVFQKETSGFSEEATDEWVLFTKAKEIDSAWEEILDWAYQPNARKVNVRKR